MRRSFKVFGGVVIAMSVMLTYAWPYIEMSFADSAHYTEKDKREYDFYTPDLLKKMPRISDRYDFDYVNITGPAAMVNAIKFYGIKNSGKIDSYLISQGYQKQKTCQVEAVCWQGKDPQEEIIIATLSNPDVVSVAIKQRFSNSASVLTKKPVDRPQ